MIIFIYGFSPLVIYRHMTGKNENKTLTVVISEQ